MHHVSLCHVLPLLSLPLPLTLLTIPFSLQVAIWGLGPIGLMIARWCQIRGASRILGIDCVTERLDCARKVLGIETINFKEQDVCKTIAQLVPGGVDSSIEAAGFEYSTTMRHKIERAVGLETDTSGE